MRQYPGSGQSEDMMRRTLFGDLHESFREVLREFLVKEVTPLYPDWVRARQVPKEIFIATVEQFAEVVSAVRDAAAR
jgi:hypothetical protein